MIRFFQRLWRACLSKLRKAVGRDRDARPVVLGRRTFLVPRLPLGVTIQVYPICKRLSEAGLVDRFLAGVPASGEEIDDLVEIAFQAAHAADPALTTTEFLAMPVGVLELFAAFIVMRLQTGAWRQLEDGESQGERTGAASPPP